MSCNLTLFVYPSLGLVSENLFTNKVFRLPTFFVSTVDKEAAVMSCKFAMQAEEVCVYTSVNFAQYSVFASLRMSVRL